MRDITAEDVSEQIFTSHSHFQRIFNVVTGISIGEYIRNRRLSLAGQDLLLSNSKVIDIAMKYQYDTSESFSKAFSRFHEISPSDAKIHSDMLKFYYPLTINISIDGGFKMPHRLIDKFCWNHISGQDDEKLTDTEKYQAIVSWASSARGQNPKVFDYLTEWILDDSQWTEDKLPENQQILLQGVFARFKEQNAQLRAVLQELKPSGLVNEAVFAALDNFDDELSGFSHDKALHEIVKRVFADFSLMKKPKVRKLIAGNKTGSTGTDSVDIFGYINYLKNCDAAVQWTLFMPDAVKRQQEGFQVESFEYKKMPAMRFIGFEAIGKYKDPAKRLEKMNAIAELSEYKSQLQYDVLFMHHFGLGVDIEPWHGYWGRFMKADTPVPKGFISFDFVESIAEDDFSAGLPFISQFAYSTFSGDIEAMHTRKGFDSDAMYDVTRNIILGQGINIPYPHKYWTAEVFPEGCHKPSTAYMFSAEL